MRRIFRFFLYFAVLVGLALIAYAYSGLMSPETRQITEPVTIDAD